MSLPPTQRQLDLLRFIAGYQRAHDGVSPSLTECAAGIGVAQKSGIFRLLTSLEERALIQRMYRRERAMKLLVAVPIPTTPDGAALYAVPGFGQP